MVGVAWSAGDSDCVGRARDMCASTQWRAAWVFFASLVVVVVVVGRGWVSAALGSVACHVGSAMDDLLKGKVFAGEEGRWAFSRCVVCGKGGTGAEPRFEMQLSRTLGCCLVCNQPTWCKYRCLVMDGGV